MRTVRRVSFASAILLAMLLLPRRLPAQEGLIIAGEILNTTLNTLQTINDYNENMEDARERLERIEKNIDVIRKGVSRAIEALALLEKRTIEQNDQRMTAQLLGRMQAIDTYYLGKSGWKKRCLVEGDPLPRCPAPVAAEIEQYRRDFFLATTIFWNEKPDHTKLPLVVLAMGYNHLLAVLAGRQDILDSEFSLFESYLQSALSESSPLNKALSAAVAKRAELDGSLSSWENRPTYCNTGQKETEWNDHRRQTCTWCRVREVNGNRVSGFPLGSTWWALISCEGRESDPEKIQHDPPRHMVRFASNGHPPVLDSNSCSEFQPCSLYEALAKQAAQFHDLETSIIPGLTGLREEVERAVAFARDVREGRAQLRF